MSAALWKKLNLEDQPRVVVIGAPAEFEPHVDWSALRFRPVEFIKNLTRDESWRLTGKGRAR